MAPEAPSREPSSVDPDAVERNFAAILSADVGGSSRLMVATVP